MTAINQIQNTEKTDTNIRAENLIKETRILNIARLAKMLVDLYGQNKPFKKVGKFEGKEIELYLKELDGYITFILTSDRDNFSCHAERAKDPVSRIIISVKEQKIIKVISSIIRSKSNIFGIAKLLKYIIPGKAKIKGSYRAAIKLVKCLMIGNHELYKIRK